MRIPTPEELRARRELLDMRQAELARKAGISQSMVARIEAGSVDPRVSTLNRILAVLNSPAPHRVTAADVMHIPVYSVKPGDPVSVAVEIMDLHNISQVPVIEAGVPVGCISESVLVNAIESQRIRKGQASLVQDFMESGFPTVPPDIDIETIVRMLQHQHAVLVQIGGKVEGVITKHDLIALIPAR